MLLIFWDVITIPLVLADATEDTQNFLLMVSHCTVWYWVVDLVYNFFTGYDTGAGIEMTLGRNGSVQNAELGEMFGTPLTGVGESFIYTLNPYGKGTAQSPRCYKNCKGDPCGMQFAN